MDGLLPHARHLETLERLLAIRASTVAAAMDEASDLILSAMNADKVDTFLYDAASHSLVALGTSNSPLSRREQALGLDRLAIANGGRAAQVFETGEVFLHGDLDTDSGELLGIREKLHVLSTIAVPLDVDGERRGVIQVDSQERRAFGDEDRNFLIAVSHWVGMVFQRAELTERRTREAEEEARQMTAHEIITVLAHDLRNHLQPVTTRLMILQSLARRAGHHECVEEAEGVAQRLARISDLLTDLLDVARVQNGLFSLDLEAADLAEVVRSTAAATLLPLGAPHVAAPESLIATFDPSRVRQALENLLANAARHAPGSDVTVDLRREARAAGDVAVISVRDQGPGIAANVLPRLSDVFFRASRAGAGLGIGLYLVRSIARAHGGELDIESAVGKGSTFRVVLPLAEDARVAR